MKKIIYNIVPLRLLTIVLFLFVLSGCAIFGNSNTGSLTQVTNLGPFIKKSTICESNYKAGYRTDIPAYHCCENVVYTTQDSSIIFLLDKSSNAAGLKLELTGLVKSELGLNRETFVRIDLKEVQRWAAVHWRKENHCQQHNTDEAEICQCQT